MLGKRFPIVWHGRFHLASAPRTSALASGLLPERALLQPRRLHAAQLPLGIRETSGGIGRQGRDIIGFRVGDTTAVPLMANPSADESAFALSPDNRWIAYESDETGRREVYVRPFPATNAGKWQASTAGGMAPAIIIERV